MFGKFIAEAIGEGLVWRILGKLWSLSANIFTSHVGEQVKEKLGKAIDSKTWADEHLFALDLAQANLTLEKKKIIAEGVKMAEDFDKLNNTHSARNFRIMVTFQDVEDLAVERPGKIILESIGSSCETKEEVFAMMEILGCMHDPTFTFEKFMQLSKAHLVPFLQDSWLKVKDASAAFSAKAEQFTADREEGYRKRLWWTRIPYIGGLLR